ncbi:cell wall-active antibiotics response protein LiaF [Staphylococcus pettenkoferi]|uniref:cell wall-active antibiotics response protein VraT n=1 Tax=Staphylococcus pettenkoferi TaxID=170573 RepID=UPI001F2DEE2B|nr:cell wall-active antibiotics response protein LiaF [Staphylococcus pettenkoferi]UIK48316.1 cell wall-active antibiotics response protein LiaF [Staphylococcus pettenkoferi]
MTHKYISTEMLIIFTALMIVANFYYIFFEKIGFLLVLLLGYILVYVGYLYFHKVRGLLAFWIGVLLVAFTLLSNKYTIIILFLFLMVMIIRYLLYKFRPLKVVATDEAVESPQFIKQKWFGQQRTPHYVYKWEDLQIQHGIGEIDIDMTKAANIKEHNVIVVRHLVGKVQVVVPLNYNIHLHFTAFFGNAYINEQNYKVENTNISVREETKPDNYTVNIYVSTFIGDIEVIYK